MAEFVPYLLVLIAVVAFWMGLQALPEHLGGSLFTRG